jgi:hypothetical protein
MCVLKPTRSIHFTFKLQTEDNVLSLIYRDILNDNFFSFMFMGIEKNSRIYGEENAGGWTRTSECFALGYT